MINTGSIAVFIADKLSKVKFKNPYDGQKKSGKKRKVKSKPKKPPTKIIIDDLGKML